LAIDLSLASLVYAARRAKDQGVQNVTFAQADILELGGLGRHFDIIECVGVLHHMESPLDGWRVLLDRLRPGGVMKVGLYSEMARREIAIEQASDAWRQITPDPDGLRGYRHDLIKRHHNQTPGLSSIVNSRDFSSMSEFRDLLFHVQECRFSLPVIEMILEELGLRFLGFELSKEDGATRFREAYPEASAWASLSKWHAFEQANPDTFGGMYQFWVERSL
jgi:SAM-dependent methyltransferase